MGSEAAWIRRRLMAIGPRGRGARVPAALRSEIAAYARRERARGVGARAIAEEIGVSSQSILRWASGRVGSAKSTALVPIVVRADEDAPSGAITVTSPGGYRVEGLTLAQAAELLRRLA